MLRSMLSIPVCLLLAVTPALAGPAGDQPAGQVKALIPDASRNAKPLAANDGLQWNDLLKTDAKGRVRVGLTDGSILSLGSNSQLKVVQHDARSQQTSIEVNYGALRNQVVKITQPTGKYEVKTPNAVIGVIGTDFYVAYENKRTTVICYAGQVAVTPTSGKQTNNTIPVVAGHMVVIGGDPGPDGYQVVAIPAVLLEASLSETNIPEQGSAQPGAESKSPAPSNGNAPAHDEVGVGSGGPQPGTESKSPAPSNGSAPAHNQFDQVGQQQLVDLINQERTKQGIPPLQVDPRLTQAAQKHTEIMVQHHALSHQFDGEPQMAARFINEHLPSDQEAENLAFAPNVVADHESLMRSPGHRANIMNPEYNVVGVAAVRSGGGVWVTQDFAHRLPEYSESQADGVLQTAIEQYAQAQAMPQPTRKPQTQLRDMACEMARTGAVNREAAAQLPGVDGALVWRTGNPAALPPHAREWLSQPMPSGYSLGACLGPGGTYWVIMVTY